MHGAREMAREWSRDVLSALPELTEVDVAVFAPATLVGTLAELAAGSGLAVGGQDLSQHESGAHTGDLSGAMLKEAGATAVLVGHSERRNDHGETDELVAEKAERALAIGLHPIVCVGETLGEREREQTESVVVRQFKAVAQRLGEEGVAQITLAYEPVWAIGTGHTATPEQAQEVHGLLRHRLRVLSDRIAAETRILYGGSVKGANAAELFAMADIDGGLIGGASLEAEDFLPICRAAHDSRSAT